MLEWTAAVQDAKRLLDAAVPLQHPSPQAELSLATDASNTHISGVMQEKLVTTWFFLQKINLHGVPLLHI
jgi:hypothetical protein